MADWRNTLVWRVLVALWGLISLALICVLAMLAAPFIGPRRAFFGITKFWALQIFTLAGIRWSVRGWEHLPADIREERQPVVFMSNHESHFDPPFLLSAIPIPAVYLAKKEVRWMPFVGWAVWAAGMIFVDRSNRERAIRSLKEAALRVRGGKSVVIFPEGTRTRTGKLGAFKKGGFHLAQEAEVPIVPLATVGGYQVLPPGHVLARPGRFQVAFGQPVSPSDYPDRDQLMAEVQRQVAALRDELLQIPGKA